MMAACLIAAVLSFSSSFVPRHASSPFVSRRVTRLVDLDGGPHGKLILVRHGQSEWNLANLFTGWVDVDLTEQGISEAREAGRLMLAAGLLVDEVHTSMMRRAIRSAVLMLGTMDQCWVQVAKHVRLNEQHSGMLTGQNKRALGQKYGVDQVMAWRRTYDSPPPEIASENALQRTIKSDLRYSMKEVPTSESLACVCKRLDPLWADVLLPGLQAGKTVMVVSHGNTLRALVKRLDGISERGSFYLDLPTATPLLYEFTKGMDHVQPHGFWGDRPDNVRHGRFLVDEAKVRAAQNAMREQVTQNIAYDPAGESIEAFQAEVAGRELAYIEGEGYTVRQTPPTYFAQEGARLEKE